MMLERFPRCAAYLNAIDGRILRSPDMTEKWAAVIMCDALPIQALKSAGVDYDTQDTDEMLRRMEGALTVQRRKPNLPKAEFESLKAFFGSRGIRASRLKTNAEFWDCALTLWPDYITKYSEDLDVLLMQIKKMSKRQRRSGRDNMHALKKLRPDLFEGMEASQ